MQSKKQIRASVRHVLALLSSKEQQINFQQQSPSANVALELLCLWFNELYNPGSQLFSRSFSNSELTAIQEFNHYYNLRKGKLPESIEELHQDQDWDVIVQESKRVLSIIDKDDE
ncbi:hypothetical protein MNBD_GAMMA22-122 [hydrothermal vent metagenome]|uniref:Uncharacterized protein n=1 Tax=hydrothermal vent metagenome TaxID=652676 RepID=A0A3B1ALM4_9ZZZZ